MFDLFFGFLSLTDKLPQFKTGTINIIQFFSHNVLQVILLVILFIKRFKTFPVIRAIFTVLFGTRNLNTNERHDGIVIAIAVEAGVKLVALIAVGVFVVWGIAGGIGPMMGRIDTSPIGEWGVDPNRWVALTALSAAAFLCLPRMFQVLVVENQGSSLW